MEKVQTRDVPHTHTHIHTSYASQPHLQCMPLSALLYSTRNSCGACGACGVTYQLERPRYAPLSLAQPRHHPPSPAVSVTLCSAYPMRATSWLPPCRSPCRPTKARMPSTTAPGSMRSMEGASTLAPMSPYTSRGEPRFSHTVVAGVLGWDVAVRSGTAEDVVTAWVGPPAAVGATGQVWWLLEPLTEGINARAKGGGKGLS